MAKATGCVWLKNDPNTDYPENRPPKKPEALRKEVLDN
jgi:hypothetical protein